MMMFIYLLLCTTDQQTSQKQPSLIIWPLHQSRGQGGDRPRPGLGISVVVRSCVQSVFFEVVPMPGFAMVLLM